MQILITLGGTIFLLLTCGLASILIKADFSEAEGWLAGSLSDWG
jgi:hypothetical protein